MRGYSLYHGVMANTYNRTILWCIWWMFRIEAKSYLKLKMLMYLWRHQSCQCGTVNMTFFQWIARSDWCLLICHWPKSMPGPIASKVSTATIDFKQRSWRVYISKTTLHHPGIPEFKVILIKITIKMKEVHYSPCHFSRQWTTQLYCTAVFSSGNCFSQKRRLYLAWRLRLDADIKDNNSKYRKDTRLDFTKSH